MVTGEIGVARMQSDLTWIRSKVDELAASVAPLVAARSGEIERIAVIQRDLDHSHEKHRGCELFRIEAMRQISNLQAQLAETTKLTTAIGHVDQRVARVERVIWMLVGGFVLLELAVRLLPTVQRFFGG